jgi:hypothetical protein
MIKLNTLKDTSVFHLRREVSDRGSCKHRCLKVAKLKPSCQVQHKYLNIYHLPFLYFFQARLAYTYFSFLFFTLKDSGVFHLRREVSERGS